MRRSLNCSTFILTKSVRGHYAKDTLVPLESQITFTDELIDQIVYRLYGLTTDEIKIVEGAVK